MFRSPVSKVRRPFGQPVAEAKGHPGFQPVPRPAPQNLLVPIDVLLPGASAKIQQAGKLVFHCVGDTGGVKGEEMQRLVAQQMETQFVNAPHLANKPTLNPDTPLAPAPEQGDPSFFYHLGDVVYYNGVSSQYRTQFYEPYQYYPAHIFAIPGNHDGDNHPRPGDPPDSEPSLYGFFENFCDTEPHFLFPYRPTLTQPHVYWTLDTPFATIVGLYANIDGLLDPIGSFQQQAWLQQQIKTADPGKWLVLAVHHPPYSLDEPHGGYPDILASLDDASKAAGRSPDLVLNGHVHNYQRFTRTMDDGKQVPHVVAGAGGYADSPQAMHKLQRDPAHNNAAIKTPFDTDVQGVRLESYNEVDGGFLRLSITPPNILCEYFAVPFSGKISADPFDSFTLAWKTKKITKQGNAYASDSGAQVPTSPKRHGPGKLPHGWPPTGPTRSRTHFRLASGQEVPM